MQQAIRKPSWYLWKSPHGTVRSRRTWARTAALRLFVMTLACDALIGVGNAQPAEPATSQQPQQKVPAGEPTAEEKLVRACRSQQIDVVRQLLDQGVDPNAAIVPAAQGRNVEMVRLLLERGADVNSVSQGDYSPLHAAAQQGGIESVKLLFAAGASIHVRDERGGTPLHAAVKGDADLEVVKFLVQSGASLDTPDERGITPVRLASIRLRSPIYEWLVKASGGKEPSPRFFGPRPLYYKSTEDLLSLLQVPANKNREAAYYELVARGAKVVPAVLERLDAEPHDSVYELLTLLGPAAEAAYPKLEAMLADPERALAAIWTIEHMRTGRLATLPRKTRARAAEAMYDGIAGNKELEQTILHFFFLGRLGDAAAPSVIKLLESDNPQIRQTALEYAAPSLVADKEFAAVLLRVVREDDDLRVRIEAADVLLNAGHCAPEVKSALIAILNSPPFDGIESNDRQRRELGKWRSDAHKAAWVLAKVGPSAIDDLLPLLAPAQTQRREPAIRALAAMGPPAIPRLIELLAHENEFVAGSASTALGQMGLKAVPALTAAVEMGSDQVAQHAAHAVGGMHRAGKPALPALVAFAGDDKHSDASRWAAVEAVMNLDPALGQQAEGVRAAVPSLLRYMESVDPETQNHIVQVLGEIGPSARDALPVLRARLESERNNTYRGAAEKAIREIEGETNNAP